MERTINTRLKMQSGWEIPQLGFGTWRLPPAEAGISILHTAVRAGYRHFDTAAAYGNEEVVGRGLRTSGLDRSEIFLTSKLPNPVRGYEETKEAVRESLRRLGTDYLDLYLIHWPNPLMYRSCWPSANAASWKAMEELYEEGILRSIGVSNFRPKHLSELLKTARVCPQVNQIKLCPGVEDAATVAFGRERGILPEAYSPVGQGRVLQHEVLQKLAKKYGKTTAQIALRHGLQKDYIIIPRSSVPEHIVQNTLIYDFALTGEDMKLLDALDIPEAYPTDPDRADF